MILPILLPFMEGKTPLYVLCMPAHGQDFQGNIYLFLFYKTLCIKQNIHGSVCCASLLNMLLDRLVGVFLWDWSICSFTRRSNTLC